MRALYSSLAKSCHLAINLTQRKCITTRPADTFASIRTELLSRQPRTYKDGVSPARLHQLLISLPPLELSKDAQDKDNVYYCLRSPDNNRPVLPQGHHLVSFNSTHPVASLLPDGTDADHSPGPPFTRRLWAGGSVSFSRGWQSLMRLDNSPSVCRESLTNVRLKGLPPGHGDKISFESVPGPGARIFVDVERLYSVGDEYRPLVVERRTLCFMTPETPGGVRRALEQPATKTIRAPNLSSQDCASSYFQSFNFTPAMLFRFSAVTFNAHKIHFDPQHCREVEGFRNLLVHGPMLLMLMFSVFNSRGHIVASLDYQNLAPVYVDEEIKVCVQQRKNDWSVWIAGPQGDLRVKGTAILGSQEG